jgi:hypothetical protein
LRSSLFDAPVDIQILKRNTKFVAEVLAHTVYGIHMDSEVTTLLLPLPPPSALHLNLFQISVFEGNNDISEEYLASWSKTLASSPRAVPYLSKKPQPPKTILTGLEQVYFLPSTFPVQFQYDFSTS